MAAEFFDASGNAIDFASVEGLEKRVSPWSFAIKFAQLLSKFGKKAWDFFYCVGLNTAWNCADEVSHSTNSAISPSLICTLVPWMCRLWYCSMALPVWSDLCWSGCFEVHLNHWHTIEGWFLTMCCLEYYFVM